MKMRKHTTMILILCLLMMSVMANQIFAGPVAGKKGCDAISKADIQDILKKLNVNSANVIHVKKSPLAGICEVAVDRGGQPAIFYFDLAKTHLIFGNLVDMKNMENLTDKSATEIKDKKRLDTSKIPLDSALVLGDAKANKKVIIFTDPDCPFCNNLHKEMKQISEKRKDIVFYIKMYPMPFHKEAYWKSKSIVCNHSMQLLEDCFDKKEIAKTECNTDEIDNNIKLAKSLGIDGTPAIILPDGRLRMGAMPAEELTKLIDGQK